MASQFYSRRSGNCTLVAELLRIGSRSVIMDAYLIPGAGRGMEKRVGGWDSCLKIPSPPSSRNCPKKTSQVINKLDRRKDAKWYGGLHSPLCIYASAFFRILPKLFTSPAKTSNLALKRF